MEENSREVVSQQEKETRAVKQSELCIGHDSVALPNDTVTGITIMMGQLVKNLTLEKAELVSKMTTIYVASYVCMYIQYNRLKIL